MARIHQSMPSHHTIDSSPLAVQTNPDTTNTTGSLNSANNAEALIQDDFFGNRSAYATEDTESTENFDNTSPSAISTPSRQESLGEYQSFANAGAENTNIAILMLIATSITLGT